MTSFEQLQTCLLADKQITYASAHSAELSIVERALSSEQISLELLKYATKTHFMGEKWVVHLTLCMSAGEKTRPSGGEVVDVLTECGITNPECRFVPLNSCYIVTFDQSGSFERSEPSAVAVESAEKLDKIADFGMAELEKCAVVRKSVSDSVLIKRPRKDSPRTHISKRVAVKGRKKRKRPPSAVSRFISAVNSQIFGSEESNEARVIADSYKDDLELFVVK